MIDIIKAIRAINPVAEVSVNDNNINQITWHNDTPAIPNEDILSKQTELQAEYDSLDYARKREAEYPKIGDQLDKIYHEGIDAWKADMITPIKNKYPKG
tara:strand:+ start:492 stop:788 length:297 start_codon:yes stop_codon:yes gene_type:complete